MICMTPHVVSSLAEPGRLCQAPRAAALSRLQARAASQAPVRQSDGTHADDGGAEAERARSWQELWGHYEGGGIMRRGLRGLGVAVGVSGMGGCVGEGKKRACWERGLRA